jgi:Ribbon-helix-helix protein, copG family
MTAKIGRPKILQTPTEIRFRAEPDQAAGLTARARALGISREALLRALIAEAIAA